MLLVATLWSAITTSFPWIPYLAEAVRERAEKVYLRNCLREASSTVMGTGHTFVEELLFADGPP